MVESRKCEECGTVLDAKKILRCTKCKACWYCSTACQSRNWRRIHKRVCTGDPLLRPYVPVEMAVERVLAKQPPMEQAPKDATCYICLEGEADGTKLMRGCACRGGSAGFVHLECLTKLAMSKEGIEAVFKSWNKCGNCKQDFTGALRVEMRRRFWRGYRSGQDLNLRYNSAKWLAICIGHDGEFHAANQLLDEASNYVGKNMEARLDLKLRRAHFLKKNLQMLEALDLLQTVLPEVKLCTATPNLCSETMQNITEVFLCLKRHQEGHQMATELVAFTKAKFGLEDPKTLDAVNTYAFACTKVGRVEEAKATFEDVFATQTRVLGREHPHTQNTRECMQFFGFAEPSG